VLVMFFAMFPLFLIFVFLFIWAPLFCAAEQFVPESLITKVSEEEAEDLEMPEDTFFRRPQKSGWFRHKAIWDLGLLRSLKFARENGMATLQIIVLLWCAHIVPAALVEAWEPVRADFSSLFMQVLFSSWAEGIALAAASGVFLMLLSKDAKAEIGIDSYRSPWPGQEPETWPGLSLGRQKLIFVLLTVAASISTFFVLERAKQEQLMPRSVAVEVQSETVENGRLVLAVRLIDDASAFRWLDTESFVVSLGSEKDAGKEAAAVSGTAEKGGEEKPSAGGKAASGDEDKYLKPDGVIAYADDGAKITKDVFTPHYGPLKFDLYYLLPENVSPGEREYSLYYRQPAGERVLLHKGDYKVENSNG
jgi:hypothetical protein